MHPPSTARRGRSCPTRPAAINRSSSPITTAKATSPVRGRKVPFHWARNPAAPSRNRASHPAAQTKGAASGAVAGSRERNAPQKEAYSSNVLGNTNSRFAKGVSRGSPPNTASCTGKVPSKAAAVTAREAATGFHSRRASPARRFPASAW